MTLFIWYWHTTTWLYAYGIGTPQLLAHYHKTLFIWYVCVYSYDIALWLYAHITYIHIWIHSYWGVWQSPLKTNEWNECGVTWLIRMCDMTHEYMSEMSVVWAFCVLTPHSLIHFQWRLSFQSPLKLPHPHNPPDRKTQISRHLTVQIRIDI